MSCRQILLLLALTTLLTALVSGTTFAVIHSAKSSSTSTQTPASTSKACNNQPSYCDRPYSTLTQIGSHDSAFVGPLPQQNQNIGITAQLDLGIRFLQAQTHKNPLNNSVIQLCHTSCFLEDAGTLESFLETVKNWLDKHSHEVVTLLLTNPDSIPVSTFDETFEAVGLKEYAFVPESSPDVLRMDKWPSLGGLIDNGSRLVVFLGRCHTHSLSRYPFRVRS